MKAYDSDELQRWIALHGPASRFVLTILDNDGEIIEVTDTALVLHQAWSDTLYALGAFTDCALLHSAGTIMTDRKDWFDEQVQSGAYEDTLTARNAVLLSEAHTIDVPPGASIRSLTRDDLPFLLEHYDGFAVDSAYLISCIHRGMLGIEEDGRLAGFIGFHPEGSMGLLYVLPKYRRRHYAEALESALIRRLQAQDRFVWCQVKEDNTPSWNLQARLGLVPADLYYWLFRKP